MELETFRIHDSGSNDGEGLMFKIHPHAFMFMWLSLGGHDWDSSMIYVFFLIQRSARLNYNMISLVE